MVCSRKTRKLQTLAVLILAIGGIMFYVLNMSLSTTSHGNIIRIREQIIIGRKSLRNVQENIKKETIFTTAALTTTKYPIPTLSPTQYPPIHDDFSSILHQCSDVKFIVLQPKLLKMMMEDRKYNRVLLPGEEQKFDPLSVLALGVFEDDNDKLETCMKKLRKKGFSIKIRLSQDFRQKVYNPINSIIPAQYIVSKTDGIILQVVILFNRKNFLWVPRVELGSELREVTRKSPFGKHARAFDRFNITKNVLGRKTVYTPKDIYFYLWSIPDSVYFECNKTITDMFSQKYDKYNNLTLGENTDKMTDILTGLLEVKSKMCGLRKRLFLAAGTLLGWARQCGVISFTQDVDTGMFAKEYSVEVTKAFLGNPVAGLRMRLGRAWDSMELRLLAGPIAIDIFLLYETAEQFWLGGHFFWQGNYTRYKVFYPKFRLCSCSLAGYRFNIPCDYNKVLTAEYGTDWYRPKESWGINDPLTFQWNGIWTEDDLPKVHQIFED